MGVWDKIKQKFHNEPENKNRMMGTENNKQEFGVPTDAEPRNRMMDTISNEQGAEFARQQQDPTENVADKLNPNKNTLTHTLSNEDAEKIASGANPLHEDTKPKNKLFDLEPNDRGIDNVASGDIPLNSDRVK